MNAEKIHLALLTYLPVFGFAAYGIVNGFEDNLFHKILITGWIVVVIYQTILSAVYSPPSSPVISIAALLLTPLLLLITAWIQNYDFSVIFIEMAAIDMMGVIIGLSYAFIHKAVKEGTKNAPVFAIVFTIALMMTAGFFLGKLFYRFFEIQNFDLISMAIVLLAIFRSIYFFAGRLTGNIGGTKKEMSVSGILITLGIWFILVPLSIWIRSMIIPYQ